MALFAYGNYEIYFSGFLNNLKQVLNLKDFMEIEIVSSWFEENKTNFNP